LASPSLYTLGFGAFRTDSGTGSTPASPCQPCRQ
jgi:hypothetical protein